MITAAGPVVGQKEAYAAEHQGKVDAVVVVNGRREVLESLGEIEVVYTSGLAQLDVSPAQVLVHVAGRERSRRRKRTRDGGYDRRSVDMLGRVVLRVHGTRSRVVGRPRRAYTAAAYRGVGAGSFGWPCTSITTLFTLPRADYAECLPSSAPGACLRVLAILIPARVRCHRASPATSSRAVRRIGDEG